MFKKKELRPGKTEVKSHFPAFIRHDVHSILSKMKGSIVFLILSVACVGLAQESSETNSVASTNAPPATTNAEPAATNNLIKQTTTNGVSKPKTNAPIIKQPSQADLLKDFQIKKGFKLELVASEPMVGAPIAMAFDENGRLFVVEVPQVPRADTNAVPKGLVRVLEDTDDDGIFDSSSVYADDLDGPTSLICYAGGVFVGTSGKIHYLKDTVGDGVADAKRVTYVGFRDTTNKLNGPVVFNGFAWGLDNRIHCTTEGTGGDIITGTAPTKQSLVLSEGNFAFDPRTFQLFDETGSSQKGTCFDSRGRRFVSYTNAPVLLVMYEQRYAVRNQYYEMPNPLLNVAADGPAKDLYFLNRPGARGIKPGNLPQRVAGSFTAAGGLTIYREALFGPEYQENAFAVDTANSVLHRSLLRANGVELLAERPPDEQNSEFLAGQNPSFRPRQVIPGPDGALYIADSGLDSKGNIYRVVPVAFKQPKVIKLGKATVAELVKELASPSGWRRDTATRLLYERQDKNAVAPVIQLLYSPTSAPLGKVHALHVLEGMKVLVEMHVMKSLDDIDDRVREHALLLLEKLIPVEGGVSTVMWRQLAKIPNDPSPKVRYQFAFTLGQARNGGHVEALAATLRSDFESVWMRSAVLSSLSRGAVDLLAMMIGDASFRSTHAGREFLRDILIMIGTKNAPGESPRVFASLRNLPEPLNFFYIKVFGNGLRCARSSLAQADGAGALNPVYARARRLMLDINAAESLRVPAILFLENSNFNDMGVGAPLIDRLDYYEPAAVQSAAVIALGRMVSPQIAPTYVQRWPLLRQPARKEAIVAMLTRPDRTEVLMSAFDFRSISVNELSSTQILFLLGHPHKNIREAASRVISQKNGEQRQRMLAQFLPSAQMPGSSVRGRGIFLERCGVCHNVGNDGNVDGMGLAPAAGWSKEKLVTKIVNPNLDINPEGFLQFLFTTDGEMLLGFIARENKRSVTLCQEDGVERFFPRHELQSLQNLGFSAMPEGLEAGLNPQQMSDLLQFLVAAPK